MPVDDGYTLVTNPDDVEALERLSSGGRNGLCEGGDDAWG